MACWIASTYGIVEEPAYTRQRESINYFYVRGIAAEDEDAVIRECEVEALK